MKIIYPDYFFYIKYYKFVSKIFLNKKVNKNIYNKLFFL